MSSIIWLTITFGMSAGGTFAIRTLAVRRGLYDHPNDRSSHTVPTPRLGGIAIVVAALTGWAGMASSSGAMGVSILPMAVGGALVALVGLVDDLRGVSASVKLAGQIVAVVASLAFGHFVNAPADLFGMLIVAVWLLTYMNFFNFMDGSDGLAAGVAALAALGLGLLGGERDATAAIWVALVISASAAGFLVFNFPPASIFMGDSGSLFLGYGLGMVAYDLSELSISPAASGLVLSPFLFDAGFTLVRRAIRREVLWLAHRSHLYQRLIATGVSHRRVALLYYGWSTWGTLLGWGWLTAPALWRPWIIACALLPGGLLALHVQVREARTVPSSQTSDGR